MRLKSSNVLFFSILMFLNASVADTWIDPDTGWTWSYRIVGDTAELYNNGSAAVSPCPNGAVEMPDSLGGMPVISIGEGAFSYCTWLTEVQIPASVSNVGSRAFAGCTRLTGVAIPLCVTNIGYWAFGECEALTTIELFGGLRNIDDYAFYGCSNLTKVTIPNSVTRIGHKAFDCCNEALFDTTTIPGLKLLDGWVVGISDAFPEKLDLTGARGMAESALLRDDWTCPNLRSLVIPETFKIVPNYAFEGFASLTNAVIHSGVVDIGDYAFCNCSMLHAVELPDTLTNIGAYAFAYCERLSNATMSDSVRSIGEGAFYNCNGLTNVTIGSGLAQIGALAFLWNTNLTTFTVSPSNVHFSFENGLLVDKLAKKVVACPGGTVGEIVIPGGVVETGPYAVAYCPKLTRVLIPSSATNIAEGVFAECPSLLEIVVAEENSHYTVVDGVLYDIDMQTLVGCVGTKEGAVDIPETVRIIVAYAFSGCKRITEIHIPNDVTSIGGHAFEDCIGLKEVTIPGSASFVGPLVFFGCTNLMSVTIPQCVVWQEYGGQNILLVSYETSVVYDDQGNGFYVSGRVVPNVTLADGVLNVSDYAFYTCCGLKSVTMPNSVTNIGVRAFASCVDLESVIIYNSQATIQADAFRNCISLRSATLPGGAFQSSYYAAPGIPLSIRQALTNIVFCNGTTKIESLAGLADSTALKSVTIPSSVTRIGDSVFKDCAALTDIYFEGNAPDMGADVFLGTPRSLVVHVPEGSIGWSDDFSETLPSSWNGRRIAYVSDSGSGGSGSSGGGSSGEGTTASAQVALTVTNVVVHYVLNSIVPEMAVPVSGDTGFVTVVTEIKGGAVAVAESWATNYPGFTEKFGSDFSAALTKTSGKRDSQGNTLLVWQDYVAGTDPTDENDIFKASITLVDGVPQVSYTPELPEAETAKRKYTTYGKARLQDEEWSVVDGDAANYNFFKVTVEMR